MNGVHFEIGHVKQCNIERNESETESVFSANTFKEVLQVWKEKGYSSPEYFIDV